MHWRVKGLVQKTLSHLPLGVGVIAPVFCDYSAEQLCTASVTFAARKSHGGVDPLAGCR